ncbi:MAG: hypothetical protein ACK2UW_00870, partial [Anaerolineales bacterium]
MKALIKLKSFLASYRKESVIALILLTSVVFMDLAIPRLIQRIIDQGIALSNPTIILQTTLIMLGITVLSAVFAIGNNLYSVRVGEGVGRDGRLLAREGGEG